MIGPTAGPMPAGLWQFIDSTGKLYGLDNNWWRDERRDPSKATKAAADAPQGSVPPMFDGNWYLAVAAYNAGAGQDQRAVRQIHTRDFWKLSRGKYLQRRNQELRPQTAGCHADRQGDRKNTASPISITRSPSSTTWSKVPTATDLRGGGENVRHQL